MGCLVHFYRWHQFKVILWAVYFVQETSPNFLQRRTRVDGTADNADSSQSQTDSDDRLLSHVTLGRVECGK